MTTAQTLAALVLPFLAVCTAEETLLEYLDAIATETQGPVALLADGWQSDIRHGAGLDDDERAALEVVGLITEQGEPAAEVHARRILGVRS